MTIAMAPTFVHALFDVLAWLVSLSAVLVLRRTWFPPVPQMERMRMSYAVAVLLGAGVGAWLFGTANLWLSGLPGFGRSIEGALAGAIVAVEVYKRASGIQVRTGAIYALPLALGVAIGRIGCLLAGIEDQTYGIATSRDWGWDFGDGVLRHPVQLYESVAMAMFAVAYVAIIGRGSHWWRRNGFYLAVCAYAVQRFVWEFLKPYDAVLAGLTLFQLLSVALACYGLVMIMTQARED
jgi:prolipoprotein diacylglyceryltransferase